MADEIFKPDANFKAGGLVGGVSSVDGSSKLVLRLNPTTKRLLVDVNGATTVTDGEAVDATDVGTLVLGTDGSNYQILSTNSSGRLQVDIVSGGGGGTQYQEDAAHQSGDTGTLALAVRKDTAAQVAQTDGDYTVLITDANGRLHVLDQNSAAILSALQGTLTVGSHAVTNAGTFVVQENGAALTALQLIDNIVLAEDQASANADPGVQLLAVRKATPANLSGLDGDYEPLQVSAGRLWVDASGVTLTVGSHAVTNAGTFVVQENGSALTSLQLIDNLVLAEDQASANADPGVGLLAVRKATPANTSGLDGDYEFLQMSGGRLWVSAVVDTALPAGTNAIGKLAANSGVDIGDVDVTTVGTITPGTAATSLGKAEDAAHTSGDVGVFILGVANAAQSTFGADGDYAPLATDIKGNLNNVGNIAHDGVDAGNPVKVGYKAVASPKGLTLVAASDRTDGIADVDGIQITKSDTANDDVISERVSNTDGASTAFSNFGAVASTHNCIRSIVCWNASATNGYVDFRDGTAGSILWTMPLPATGGSILPPCSPFHFRTSQNTALAFDVSAALTTVYISVSGYQSKS